MRKCNEFFFLWLWSCGASFTSLTFLFFITMLIGFLGENRRLANEKIEFRKNCGRTEREFAIDRNSYEHIGRCALNSWLSNATENAESPFLRILSAQNIGISNDDIYCCCVDLLFEYRSLLTTFAALCRPPACKRAIAKEFSIWWLWSRLSGNIGARMYAPPYEIQEWINISVEHCGANDKRKESPPPEYEIVVRFLSRE